MANNPRQKNGNARRKLRARLKAEQRPCALCGRSIDYSLPAGHPYSFEVDEIIPVSRGGNPFMYSNVQPTHRICNQRKGNNIKVGVRNKGKKSIITSRKWTE